MNVRFEAPSTTLRVIRALALLTLVCTYLLLVLGSTVRVTNSGMGCIGWPLCSGQVGPIDHLHPLMEQTHRFLATVVTVLIGLVASAVWRAGAPMRHVRTVALTSVGLIVVQIVLGAVTVVTNNAPITVALHLLVATAFLGVVTVTVVGTFVTAPDDWSVRRGVGPLAWSAGVALYLIIISGSVVVDAGAQGACRSWPLCGPSTSSLGLVVVQSVHRGVVGMGTILVVWYLASHLRRRPHSIAQGRLATIALVLLAAQIAVGALSAFDDARAATADVHLALASALWATFVALVALSATSSHDASQRVAPGVVVAGRR